MVEVSAASIPITAPPRTVDFIWGQRHPSDVAKTEPDAPATAEAEERDQRGRPVMPGTHQAGVPAPAKAVITEPAAVVIGSPAPWISTDPSPAIPIQPRPPPVMIRSPVRGDPGMPHVAVF